MRFGTRRNRLVASGATFLLCCAADGFVLRGVLTSHDIASEQFRRGYFERFGGEVGLALDRAVRPGMIPSFQTSHDGALEIPPGMIAVLPLAPGTSYESRSSSSCAPYVVLGDEAPVPPVANGPPLSPGEARLIGARTLAVSEGRLALVEWDPVRPWREDSARLCALRDACVPAGDAAALELAVTDDRLDVRLGGCSLAESHVFRGESQPLLAVLGGAAWLTTARRPAWSTDSSVVRPLLAGIAVKVATTWWGAGIASAAAVSLALAGAAVWIPVPAILAWPLTVLLRVAAALLRLSVLGLQRLPRRARVPVVLGAAALGAGLFASRTNEPHSFPPVVHIHGEPPRADRCAVLGYSAVKGEGLRHERGGIRTFLDEDCGGCRQTTAGLCAGGETLAWARDAFCSSDPAFGAHGLVTFMGGANDDFFTGMVSIARLFIVSGQGSAPWSENVTAAAAASRRRLDVQTSAIASLGRCIQSRGARFLFLHDFLATDLHAGRDPDRAAMLAARRLAVEAAGGTFVDLFDVFGPEAGVSWFNDYVHPSLLGHERIAEFVCRQMPWDARAVLAVRAGGAVRHSAIAGIQGRELAMDDHSDGEGNRGGPRDDRGGDRSRDHGSRNEGGERGPGSDTRFLQLEMSHVLYSEAEAVARPAFRDLLLEAAKERLRERFGEEITALANLAVDDLLKGVEASFEIEARIQRHNDEPQPSGGLREIVAAWRARGQSRPAQGERSVRRTPARAKGKR